MSNVFESLKHLADNNRLSHAYLFFGPENAPKKECALALARHLEGKEIFQDTLSFENIAIGINEVRKIKKFLYQTPIQSKKRTCVIHDAERLSWQAAPALLKIVEEPPEKSLIIMTAKEKNVLSPALLSRLIKIYIPPLRVNLRSASWRIPRQSASTEISLAEEIEQRMIELYQNNKIKNAKKISFLLHKLEMSRLNLNPKLQKKAIEHKLSRLNLTIEVQPR